MFVLNHTITASLIVVAVKEPIIVAPLALVSHFVLDTIPHHGENNQFRLGTRNFNIMVAIDGVLSLIFAFGLFLILPEQRLLLTLAVFLAVLPDLLWPLNLKANNSRWLKRFFSFHKNIQHESPAGIAVEILWFGLMSALLINWF